MAYYRSEEEAKMINVLPINTARVATNRCICSPTSHSGSFRCSLHRSTPLNHQNTSYRHTINHPPSPSSSSSSSSSLINPSHKYNNSSLPIPSALPPSPPSPSSSSSSSSSSLPPSVVSLVGRILFRPASVRRERSVPGNGKRAQLPCTSRLRSVVVADLLAADDDSSSSSHLTTPIAAS